MESEIVSQFTSAAVVVYLMQMLKRAQWFPWLTMETAKMNHVVAVVAAGVSALGVHFAFSSSEGTLLITGLNASTIAHTAWHWANQYALQRVTYDTVAKPQAGA